MTDPTMADPTAGAGASPMDDAPGTDDQGTEDQGGTVLCTVMVSQDGTYILIKGDEDEGATDEGGGAVEGDMTIPAVGSASTPPAMSDEGSQGQQFDSIGGLLKGILDLAKDHEANASGEGTESDNFDVGYSGGAGGAPTMKQQPPANMRT